MINLICRLHATSTRQACDKALARIQRQSRGQRGRAAAQHVTPAVFKWKWVESYAGDLSRLESRVPALVSPWAPPIHIEVAGTKKDAIKLHIGDPHTPALRVYTDGSGLNGRIAAAVVG